MVRNVRHAAAWTAAGLLAAAGILMLIAGLATPASFGWFAYQPLADAAFTQTGTGAFASRTTITGVVLLVIGLIASAFLGGRAAGKRRS